MARVRWTRQARTDVRAIRDFFARDSPGVAEMIADRLFRATGRLEQFPNSGREIPRIRSSRPTRGDSW
ncbi:MAG: type II toxin-antitoxin system RelE/ParE family toxin [Longimicrobiaceae bacterium]